MDKVIKQWNMKKAGVVRYGYNLLLLFIFWGGLIRPSFNADTLSHMFVADADVMTNILDGRYVIALGDWLLLLMGMRVTDHLLVAVVLSLFLFAGAACVLQNLFAPFKPHRTWSGLLFDAALTLVFLNFLFAEDFMFVECCIYFGIAYLMATLGVWFYSRKKYVPAVLLLLIGVCTYQYSAVYAAIILAFYGMMEQKATLSFKNVLKELSGILLCLGMGGINILMIKLVTLTGLAGEFRKNMDVGGWGEKLNAAWNAVLELNRTGYGILPPLWIPALVSLAALVVVCWICWRTKAFRKLVYLLLVDLGSMLLLLVIPVMNGRFNFPPRMAFCFFLVQGLMLCSAFWVTETSEISCKELLSHFLCFVLVCYLLVQYLFISLIEEDRYVTNNLDCEIAAEVDREITRYEAESGIQVTKLAVVNDTFAPAHYDCVEYAVQQINEKTIFYAPSSLIRYVTGRELERIEMDQTVYSTHFQDRNWDVFDPEEQLVFVGDTLYWCIF